MAITRLANSRFINEVNGSCGNACSDVIVVNAQVGLSLGTLDAPLGWPVALGSALLNHSAGQEMRVSSDKLFRLETDDHIYRRLGKRPLKVGANLIARTAVAALGLLGRLRKPTGKPIPISVTPNSIEGFCAIEVYPAATRIGHRALDQGGSFDGLRHLIDVSLVSAVVQISADAADATVCALAAADFMLEKSEPPTDLKLATTEGWIWAVR